MSMMLILPALTAVVTVACAVWPAAGRLVWLALALGVVNVALTPFASGEWFYQRSEASAFRDAVTRGDFTSFDDMMSRHDPHRLRTTVVIAVSLLAAICGLALVRYRGKHGGVSTRMSSIAAVIAVVVGAGALLAIFGLRT